MLKDLVREEILRNRSGAIAVRYSNSRGSCSADLRTFAKVHLQGVKVGKFGDILVDIDKGVLHPLTEVGWARLEQLYELFGPTYLPLGKGYFLQVNTCDCAHSATLFKGLLDVSHDSEYISREQRETEISRKNAGYGTSRMGGWIET